MYFLENKLKEKILTCELGFPTDFTIILRSIWLDPVVYILIVKFYVEGIKTQTKRQTKQNKTKKKAFHLRGIHFVHFAATNGGKKYKHVKVIRIE